MRERKKKRSFVISQSSPFHLGLGVFGFFVFGRREEVRPRLAGLPLLSDRRLLCRQTGEGGGLTSLALG